MTVRKPTPPNASTPGAEQHYWTQIVVGEAGLARFVQQVRQAWAAGERLAFDRLVCCAENPLVPASQGETRPEAATQGQLPLEREAADD